MLASGGKIVFHEFAPKLFCVKETALRVDKCNVMVTHCNVLCLQQIMSMK